MLLTWEKYQALSACTSSILRSGVEEPGNEANKPRVSVPDIVLQLLFGTESLGGLSLYALEKVGKQIGNGKPEVIEIRCSRLVGSALLLAIIDPFFEHAVLRTLCSVAFQYNIPTWEL